MSYQILESRHHQKHEMVAAAASLRWASHLRPLALLCYRYRTELPIYRNAHCGLVVGVLAMGPGNPPTVRVWTAKTGLFRSRPVQKCKPLTIGGPNPDPYPSTRGFRWVWLHPSVPISGSAFRVSHLWSHSDMLLLIVKYWHWYVTVHFRCNSRLDVQNKYTHAPNHILKMSVNRASTERQQSVNRASTERQQSVNRASTIFGLAICFAYKGSQWFLYDWLQPIRGVISQDA